MRYVGHTILFFTQWQTVFYLWQLYHSSAALQQSRQAGVKLVRKIAFISRITEYISNNMSYLILYYMGHKQPTKLPNIMCGMLATQYCFLFNDKKLIANSNWQPHCSSNLHHAAEEVVILPAYRVTLSEY